MMSRGTANILSILVSFLLAGNVSSQQVTQYSITRMPFSSSVFNEISPVIVSDGVIFCSDRRVSNITDRTAFDGRRLFNIFYAERQDSTVWGKPVEYKTERSSLFNNGPLCIAPDGITVYFTSEIETGPAAKSRDFENHSGLFTARISGSELISVEPFGYNSIEYDIAQPSVSADSKYLFFSSDMPGGQGGSDIYYCEWIDGEWGPPVNLGPKVNTPAAENYPNIHPSGYLYFTSDRQGGIGGLDIYYTSLSYGGWSDPVLLPEPLNSSSDDFALVAGDNLRAGFFSSNRRRSDDIYTFNATTIRKTSCEPVMENNYCYEFLEENAVKYDSMPFRYEWRFGDGAKDTGALVQHCYAGPGTYIVQLDVVNLLTREVLYNEKSDTLVLSEFEQPFITAPDSAVAGSSVVFSSEGTNLPGWDIAEYYWNFGDNTVAVGNEVRKIFETAGNYDVQLIVTSRAGEDGLAREACVSKNITILLSP